MSNYTNKYAARSTSSMGQWLLGQVSIGLVIHWLFQGMLAMDPTERRFKLLIDLVLTVASRMLLAGWLPGASGWLVACFIAHTLNFLFNAQLWVALKHYGLVSHTRNVFEGYMMDLAARVERQSCFFYAAVYGSYGRAEWRPSSDLDLRLVRRPGWNNGLRSCLFVLAERTRALRHGFPLDIYVLDTFASLSRLRPDEIPAVWLDNRPGAR